ncbi:MULTISPECIES: S24 family peptidase [Thioalkalivibrio]|uniref:Phage repressor protein n=1 Tax=Thioalkalivibrio halophilus TaxID=252474 RepID=A0A1V3A1E3_9GAMM|nr:MULTISPECIES: S24 family peptidase [Thioalkalivibrio]OOC11170.1 phage repressor protein [Thioalkalivibrio halophilus]
MPQQSRPNPAMDPAGMGSGCSSAEPFALRVLGNSMAPEFEHGVIVIVDPSGAIENGSFVVARHDDEYLLRQLIMEDDAWYLQALQEDQRRLELADRQAVIGVVVQRAGRRRSGNKHYA